MSWRNWFSGGSERSSHHSLILNWPSAVFGGGFGLILGFIISLSLGASLQATIIALILAFAGGHLLVVAAGLRKIPVAHWALKLWLGARIDDEALKEGWQWWWPNPLGSLLVEDCRIKNLDIPINDVTTKDKVEVELDVSISYRRGPENMEATPKEWADALNLYTNVTPEDFVKQLRQEAAEKFRAAAAQVDSEDIHKSRDDILNGNDEKDIEGVVGALREKAKACGVYVTEVQIADIDLPEEIVEAAAQEKAEKAQRRAEATERMGIQEAITGYKNKGLTATEAARLHAVERGKIRETVQTINIPGIETVGSLIASAIAGKLSSSDKEESK